MRKRRGPAAKFLLDKKIFLCYNIYIKNFEKRFSEILITKVDQFPKFWTKDRSPIKWTPQKKSVDKRLIMRYNDYRK